jgi:hypothetical protein
MEFVFWICGFDGHTNDNDLQITIDIPLRGIKPEDLRYSASLINKAVENGDALCFRTWSEFEQKLIPDSYLYIQCRQFIVPLVNKNTTNTNPGTAERDILQYNVVSKYDSLGNLYFLQSGKMSMEVVHINHMETSSMLVMRIDWNNFKAWHCREGVGGLSLDYKSTWNLREAHMRTIMAILTGDKDKINTAISSILYNDRKDIVIVTLFAAYLGLV